MVLQSSFFDPVVGVDIHIVGIPAPPAPAPVPTPIPLPFVGLVFDPVGLAVGAAIGMAMGGGPGIVLVNSLPVTNCGTEVTNALTMPHASAPGIMFMSNGTPVLKGDAELFFGSLNVSLAGSYGVRLGDIALSCSDPVRLPTSVVLAIPKGMPVLNMPAMVPDLAAIAMAAAMKGIIAGLGALVRRGAALFRRFRQNSAFFQRLSRRLGGCTPPAGASRWRQMWHRGVRTLTGHPVDVVTGGLLTEALELELPGPIPLRIERVYESAGSAKPSTLGFGWNHSLDESLWMERGRAVVRLGDGREIEFGLWDLPERRMQPGDTLERVIHKLVLACVAEGRFELRFADGLIHEFERVPGDRPGVHRLTRITTIDRIHQVQLAYDRRARLEWIRDSCGRFLRFEHDDQGRLTGLFAPHPDREDWYRHRGYVYDASGDLVEVIDSLGHRFRYAYAGHLLVQETNRAGLSFYFQYDGVGALARCVRTWGDGGIYDHAIDYDPGNRKTFVEDSCGETTIYEYNERNQVIAITDPLGQVSKYEHDPETGGELLRVDPLGAEHRQRYDARGNLIEVVAADGGVTSMGYLGYQRIAMRDARGGEWRWHHGPGDRLLESISPAGRRVTRSWERGLLVAIEQGPGRRTTLHYDEHAQLRAVGLADGNYEQYRHDRLGRLIAIHHPTGAVTQLARDLEGRVIVARNATGDEQRLVYDPEGDLLEVRDGVRELRFRYLQHHRIAARIEAGVEQRFEYDSEGRLIAVINELGERFEVTLDGAGRISAERDFDGRTRTYVRDGAGREIEARLASGRVRKSRYDPVGRLIEVRNADDTFIRMAYDPAGLLCVAENEHARVELERDGDGLIQVERLDGNAVESSYDEAGERVQLSSSLGARVLISRDPIGRPQRLYLGASAEHRQAADVGLAHDALGLLRSLYFANGIEVGWAHDDAGRASARVLTRHHDDQREPLERLAYEWRGEQQLARVLASPGPERSYRHDPRGRLIREQIDGDVVIRALDPVGNVYRSETGDDRRYGPGGRLDSIAGHACEHDEDGNLIRRASDDGEWRYHWNDHGLLRAVERPDGGRVELEYDAFARRTARRIRSPSGALERETRFSWDGHVVVHELDSVDGITSWHWLPDTATPLVKDRGDRRWTIASDHLGTPTHMHDEAGALRWRARLDIHGRASIELGEPGDCPWRWPGQYDDVVLDELYNRCRYYSPTFGRFISQDPAGLFAGLHRYAHVDDPTLWLDLLGLTGTYIFTFGSGEMYIGKGPKDRALASQRGRSSQLGTTPASITQGAHADFGDPKMGLMVEAELMSRNKFGSNPNLLNAINSPGAKLLANATAAERAAVTANADALETALAKSKGKIC